MAGAQVTLAQIDNRLQAIMADLHNLQASVNHMGQQVNNIDSIVTALQLNVHSLPHMNQRVDYTFRWVRVYGILMTMACALLSIAIYSVMFDLKLGVLLVESVKRLHEHTLLGISRLFSQYEFRALLWIIFAALATILAGWGAFSRGRWGPVMLLAAGAVGMYLFMTWDYVVADAGKPLPAPNGIPRTSQAPLPPWQ